MRNNFKKFIRTIENRQIKRITDAEKFLTSANNVSLPTSNIFRIRKNFISYTSKKNLEIREIYFNHYAGKTRILDNLYVLRVEDYAIIYISLNMSSLFTDSETGSTIIPEEIDPFIPFIPVTSEEVRVSIDQNPEAFYAAYGFIEQFIKKLFLSHHMQEIVKEDRFNFTFNLSDITERKKERIYFLPDYEELIGQVQQTPSKKIQKEEMNYNKLYQNIENKILPTLNDKVYLSAQRFFPDPDTLCSDDLEGMHEVELDDETEEW